MFVSTSEATAFSPRSRVGGEWPLSHAQRRIWLMEQLEPGTCQGNIAGLLTARGEIDEHRLAAAVRLFVERTESVRLQLFLRDAVPLQRIAPPRPDAVEPVDVRGAPDPEAAFARWCQVAVSTPFELLERPLYRFAVLRRRSDEVVLFACVHHLICDAVSLGLFARTVSRIYQDLGQDLGQDRGPARPRGQEVGASGTATPSRPVSPPFVDSIAQEQAYLASPSCAADRAAWLQELGSLHAPALLGSDGGRSPSARATRHTRTLDQEATGALLAFVAREGTTIERLFSALAAVFVGRLTGKSDVCIGTYVHNRFSRADRATFGMFVGTLPLRFQLSPAGTFSTLLEQGGRVVQRALRAARYPYDRLLHDLGQRGALFDVVVSHQSFVYQSTLDGAPVNITWLFNGHEAHALAIHISDRVDQQTLTLDFDFRDDRFADGVPEQLVESFLHLCRAVVGQAPGDGATGPTLSGLSLTSPRQEATLRARNPDPVELARDLRAHDRFEENARSRPDLVAVRSGDELLTYGELDARASGLARRLRARGVGACSCVGLLTGRSPELLVGLLGILKSGACYLPIDPIHPRARVEFMLADADCRVLVVDATMAARAGELTGELAIDVVCTDDHARDEPRHRAPPAAASSPEDLAYIIYTSGSSGKPKGVMLEHRSVVNFLTGMAAALPLAGVQRVLCTTTVSFDIFVLETLLPLTLGLEIVLASEEEQRAPELLADLIGRGRVDLVQLTPSRLQLLLDHPAGLDALRRVALLLVGGEALPPRELERLGPLATTRVFNMYGPTETTVWSSCADLTGEGRVHVGRPVQNTEVFIVDADGALLPPGVAGEVCIGGDGVARGYLNRPALDARSFFRPDFARGRLYRTGDLGSWTPAGELVLHGRRDAQLKIRGHRVEPGEIEAQLLASGQVSAAAVIGVPDRTGALALVAFYVPADGAGSPRDFLRSALPPAMVPAHWIALDALPVLPSGKIDRAALAAVELPETVATERVEPATRTESLLLRLWEDVLGVSGFGVTDSFFDLGGHSLAAIALVNRIEAELGRRIPISAVFAGPSVREMAGAVEAAMSAPPEAPALAPLAPRPHWAVTPLQAAMFVTQERAGPDSTAHHMTGALRVAGPCEPARLKLALERLIQRHEALRTSFDLVDGEVVQRVHPAVPFALERVEAEGRPLEAVISRFVRPFDLRRAPLFRAAVCSTGPDEAVLIVDLHHIVSDAASIDVLSDDLAASLAGRALPEPTVQPREFAAWQAALRTSPRGRAVADFWRARHAGLPGLIELPGDRPRPRNPSFDGDSLSVQVPASVARRLLRCCHDESVTPFTFLLAAYQILLSRHAAARDVAVITPVLGRSHPEVARVVGLFVSTIALSSTIREERSMRDLVSELGAQLREALDHQDVPSLASSDGRTSSNFLFTLAQDGRAERQAAPGVTLQRLEHPARTTQYDIELTAVVDSATQGVTLRWTYRTCLFDRERIAAMAARYQTLLEQLAADIARPLHAATMLIPDDLEALRSFHAPTATYPEASLGQMFEAQVDRTPDAVALCFEGEALTYRELDRRANRLAHRLVQLGVGPDVPVGICLERSFEMVVSLLAVTKAGGAYVPLDPTYPVSRLDFMLSDSRPRVLLVQESQRSRVAGHTGAPVVVDQEMAEASSAPCERPHVHVDLDDLAYAIYTSGSTGQPKAAMNTHRAICNRLHWMQEQYRLTARDAVLQKTPFSFDVSVWEFFWPLMTGARLVIARSEGHKDPDYLARLIDEQQVTTLHFVPSMLEAFLGEQGMARCPSIRRVICSGEALSFGLQQRFFAQASPVAELHNLYGPTEAAVDVSHWPCEREPSRPFVPIGRPVANVPLHNLDDHQRLVPVGVAGELHIAGVAVGRGYMGRPELTAERFVPDPFSSAPGARMYRTGDRVRLLADGAIEYLGRTDDQIKIRGFRIELGEIESVLSRHASVRECAVIARDDSPGPLRLCAYVRPEQPESADEGTAHSGLSVDALVEHARTFLPSHMVPSAWVTLDALPLSPSGKLDRAALPAPVTRAQTHEPPRGATEEQLAAIWSETLGVERIGRHDDFFALGGHSLLATQVASRIRVAFQVDVPLRVLFEVTTLEALAERIDLGAVVQGDPITRAPEDERARLSFSQQRLWFLAQLEQASPLYNIAGAARLSGSLDVDRLTRALQGLVRRHEVLRTSYAGADGDPRAQVADDVVFALSRADLSGKADAAVDAAVTEECRRPFDLTRAPLLRATLIRRSDQEHLLVLVMHHIIADGWSLGLLIRELGILYADPAGLGEPPAIDYADHAAQERQRMQGAHLEAELAHWKQRLGDSPPILDLPTDRPRPPLQTFHGALLHAELSADLTGALVDLGRAAGSTLFMTLLAGFKAVLFRYTQQADVIVGSPIANRTRAETEGIVGCFVNTLALRTRLHGAMTFAQLVAQVREVTLDAYAHQHVPFEKVVESLRLERDLSRSPLVQVMFSLENVPERQAALPGLEITQLELDTGTAKFDLAVSATQRPHGLSLTFEYNTDLFDRPTIERLCGHLESLLRAAAAAPHAPIGALPLLSAAEQQHLASFERGPAPRADTTGSLFIDAFEQQVARTPEAVALIARDQTVTYQDLDARAGRLARILLAHGVGPDVMVAVCLERSVEAVVAFLAIFKAGGAYIPLDPDHPADRLGAILRDSRAPLVITTRALLAKIDVQDVRALVLEDLHDRHVDPGADVRCRRLPDALAYVIYTSGSTGTPKGVMISNHSLMTFLRASVELYSLGPEQRVLQFASLSVDTSIMELYPPLLVGGAAALRHDEMLSSVGAFLEQCDRWGVTFIKPPTAYWSELTFALSLGGLQLPSSVRLVGVGGEKMLPSRALEWKRVVSPEVVLFNEYGPTETTVMVTACDVTALPGRRLEQAGVPLGAPLASVRVFVLDPAGDRVPCGVPGELCIGGEIVARGYLARPDLTAERFTPDPFSDAPGQRLYRTGDRARWLADGTLEYLDRLDQQVKIRGFRVEPSEIESMLNEHASVREAAVEVREDGRGDRRLVAYLAVADPTVDAAAVKRHLRGRVPDYMVPAQIVLLPSLPHGPTDKIDRAALPVIAMSASDEPYVAPRTDGERRLAELWQTLLQVERVGANDNFFELGGHSLLATQLVSRIRAAWNVEIPLTLLFEKPTLSSLAEDLERRERASSGPQLRRLSRAELRSRKPRG